MEDFNMESIKPMIIEYGVQIITATVILIVGMWVVKMIQSAIRKGLEKKGTDPSLAGFTFSLTGMALKIMVIIAVISQLGVETTSFIAILGAAGLAIGMALSGTLQNFAGGAMILIFKPFKVGDFIDAQGYTGTVNEIQIFNTILKTPDNKTIIIPNGGLSTGSMVNFSTEPTRRVDWTFGIGYGDDADKAQEVIKRLLQQDSRILKDQDVFCELSELGDSSVNFATRAWVNAGDYWGVYFDMNKKVYQEFDKSGLSIPYPQMDVHLHKP